MCHRFPEEVLVAFADGELSGEQQRKVADHIDQCDSCKRLVGALRRSLEVTKAFWPADESRWPQWQRPARPKLSRRPLVRMTAVAASILVVLSLGLIWRMILRPSKPMLTEKTAAQLRQAVVRAGQAAQMLAVADLLAKQPQGREYARDRYMEIARDYAGTECARQAKLRLKSL